MADEGYVFVYVEGVSAVIVDAYDAYSLLCAADEVVVVVIGAKLWPGVVSSSSSSSSLTPAAQVEV
jgi:hypothetical protein